MLSKIERPWFCGQKDSAAIPVPGPVPSAWDASLPPSSLLKCPSPDILSPTPSFAFLLSTGHAGLVSLLALFMTCATLHRTRLLSPTRDFAPFGPAAPACSRNE